MTELELFDPADARADYRSASPDVFVGKIEPGVVDSVDRRVKRVLHKAVKPLEVTPSLYNSYTLPRLRKIIL